MGLAQPKVRPYTYADYLTWDDDERWEIIDGVVYSMSPGPNASHQTVLINLAYQFMSQIGGSGCKVYVAPFDVRLTETGQADKESTTVVQPDLMVVCDKSKIDERGIKGAPDMIVEVLSPSTASRDLIAKLALYERHGVREYWTVHPVDGLFAIWRPGPDGLYARPVYHGLDTPVPCLALPGVVIDPKLVFEIPEKQEPVNPPPRPE